MSAQVTTASKRSVQEYVNFNPSLGCTWCGKPFRSYTNKTVSSSYYYPIYVRRTIKFNGRKCRVRGVVDALCDQFLHDHQYTVRTSKLLGLEEE